MVFICHIVFTSTPTHTTTRRRLVSKHENESSDHYLVARSSSHAPTRKTFEHHLFSFASCFLCSCACRGTRWSGGRGTLIFLNLFRLMRLLAFPQSPQWPRRSSTRVPIYARDQNRPILSPQPTLVLVLLRH